MMMSWHTPFINIDETPYSIPFGLLIELLFGYLPVCLFGCFCLRFWLRQRVAHGSKCNMRSTRHMKIIQIAGDVDSGSCCPCPFCMMGTGIGNGCHSVCFCLLTTEWEGASFSMRLITATQLQLDDWAYG